MVTREHTRFLWLALFTARCSTLAPPPRRFGGLGASTGGDGGSGRPWLALAVPPLLRKKRALVAVAAAGLASQRSLRRSARFECGLARIGLCYGQFHVETALLGRTHAGSLEDVHEATALRLEALVADLKGAYVKSAQLVSTAFPELLPQAWVSRLELMVDHAPARPWSTTRAVLERELQQPVEHLFSAFEESPVGAASIGQVHKAVVRATNETVAVKVMFPGGKRLVLSDLDNVRRVLKLAKPALLPAVDAFRERVALEFDYLEEAERMDACARFVEAYAKLSKRVTIPKSKPELTTTKVLTMDWLEGRSLRDELESRAAGAKGTAFAPLRLWRYLALRRLASSALETVVRAQGAMIFSPDCGFSADPHPGNVMLLQSGKVALIDYGCSSRFDDDERRTLADLYCALERRDPPEVVSALTDMGFVSQHMNKTLMLAFATQCFDADVVDDGRSPYAFLAALEKHDKVLRLPQSYMLVTRVSLLLRGLGARVGCGKLSMARMWKAEARACQRSLPTRSRRRTANAVVESTSSTARPVRTPS